MIRHTTPLVLIGFAILASSCGSDLPLGKVGDLPNQRKVANPFTLKFGESAIVDPGGFEVSFTAVRGDSRCPADVVCIWEGAAAIELRLATSPSDTHLVPLLLQCGGWQGGGMLPPPLDTLGYRIRFLQLDPYPLSTVTINDSDRVATLAIFPFTQSVSGDGEVQITDWTPSQIQKDAWRLIDLAITGDELMMEVEHSGGCADHEFDLFMSPAAFLESAPVQANLYMRHDGNDDACEALIRRTLRFDLRSVAQLYEIMYGRLECIVLNVHAFNRDGAPEEKTPILYHPVGSLTTPPCGQAGQAANVGAP